jgi:hypothetical protein
VTVAAAVFAALVLGFAVTARWLSRVYLTAPITFVAAGAVISAVTPSTTADVTEFVKVLAEVTLALILFHDAAQVRPRQIEADRGLILRLLLVGLPLTVLVGIWAAGGALPAARGAQRGCRPVGAGTRIGDVVRPSCSGSARRGIAVRNAVGRGVRGADLRWRCPGRGRPTPR